MTKTDFERFFDGPFQQRLERVKIPPELTTGRIPLEASNSSWDRRAAYLLWIAEGRPVDSPLDKPVEPEDKSDADDNFGY
jgi:hypothetical protein